MSKPKPQKKSAAAKAAAANSSTYTRSGKNGKQVELDRLFAAAGRKEVAEKAEAKATEAAKKAKEEAAAAAENAELQTAEAVAPAEAGLDQLFAELRQESEAQQAVNAEEAAKEAEEAAKKAFSAETALIKKSAKTLSEDLMSHIRLAGKMDLVRRFRDLYTRDKDDVFAGIDPSRKEFLDEICEDLVKELSKSALPASWWAKWTAGVSENRRWEIFWHMLLSDAASADNDRCHARIAVFRGLLTKLAEECGYHQEWWKLTAADPRSMMQVLKGYAREILATSIARSIVTRAQAILPMLNGIVTVPATVTNAIWQISCLEKAGKKKTDAVFAGKTLGRWLFVDDGVHGAGIETWLVSKANQTQRLALAAKFGIGQGIRISSLAQSVFAQLGITNADDIQSFVDSTLGIRRESESTTETESQPAEAAAPADEPKAE
jgi:hypothetical protein